MPSRSFGASRRRNSDSTAMVPNAIRVDTAAAPTDSAWAGLRLLVMSPASLEAFLSTHC